MALCLEYCVSSWRNNISSCTYKFCGFIGTMSYKVGNVQLIQLRKPTLVSGHSHVTILYICTSNAWMGTEIINFKRWFRCHSEPIQHQWHKNRTTVKSRYEGKAVETCRKPDECRLLGCGAVWVHYKPTRPPSTFYMHWPLVWPSHSPPPLAKVSSVPSEFSELWSVC
jgi:hypothetical protein